jgi:hypothetical protein
MAELKPPEIAVVIFDVPDDLLETVTVVGEAANVNAGVAVDVTVSETVVVAVTPPPVPVMVMG